MNRKQPHVIPFRMPLKGFGYEPTLDQIKLAIKESQRIGEPINVAQARELLIELNQVGAREKQANAVEQGSRGDSSVE